MLLEKRTFISPIPFCRMKFLRVSLRLKFKITDLHWYLDHLHTNLWTNFNLLAITSSILIFSGYLKPVLIYYSHDPQHIYDCHTCILQRPFLAVSAQPSILWALWSASSSTWSLACGSIMWCKRALLSSSKTSLRKFASIVSPWGELEKQPDEILMVFTKQWSPFHQSVI